MLFMRKPMIVLAATSLLGLACLGCGDSCEDSEFLGRWHQEEAPTPTWIREDITFRTDCTCRVAEYEGSRSEDEGEYEDLGGGRVSIDMDDFVDLDGERSGDRLDLVNADGVALVYYRQ